MNKLTKLLSVFIIAGALGAGIAGVAGCKKNGGSGGGGGETVTHTESHKLKHEEKAGTGKHTTTCTVEGCDYVPTENDHVWGDDNVCDDCGAVKIAVQKIEISGAEEVAVGEKITLTATVTPSDATESVVWSIKAGAEFAQIDPATGELTGIKEGLVTVQAAADGKTATKYIAVKAIALKAVTLAKKNLSLKPGENATLVPEFDPANATNKKINWFSSAPAVATVDAEGKVTAVADGTATVTGTTEEGNYKVTCTVEVDHSFVDVKYEVNVTEKFEAVKSDADRRVGFVTVGAGTEVRNRTKPGVYENKKGGALVSDVSYDKSIKIGGNTDKITFNIPSHGTLIIHIQNGSSGVEGWRPFTFTKRGGSSRTIYYSADDGSPTREVIIEIDQAGEYDLTRSDGTSDVFYASYTGRVKETPLESIQVASPGKNEYFVGQTYSYENVQLDKVFESTGRTESLDVTAEGVTVDSSKVDMTQSGTYPVTITYNDGTKDYTAEPFYVTVYAVDSISIGKNATVKESQNTSAGNGVYANHHLRELYFAGDTFSTDGMTITVNASIGSGAEKRTQSFIIHDGYTLSGNDVSTAGKKTVTVTLTGTSHSESFEVYVISGIADLSTAQTVNVNVDAGTADADVGVIKNDAYQFKTIHQALEFLENCKASATANKVMTLAAGKYEEKLEINVPNLTVIGAGTDQEGVYSMIEWDSLYGVNDESGYAQVTDSTATLNVREKAVGFTMRNVIVSNYFNCVEHFNERMGVGYAEHRALAMLIQADKVRVENSTLLGYQDTLEVFTGRHVFQDCLIVGVTDFIFGTNGTTYFNGCEIRAIRHVNDVNPDSSTGKPKGQVGYITAMKGNNNGSDTKVKYGIIFDDCDFTAENGITQGWALGRTWGADAAVMVMNSRIGGHISNTTSRYIAMNGVPQNAQFTEHGNTGAGAINTSITGVTVIADAAEAAKYAEFTTIFADTNGLVKYADAWDGQAGAKIATETYDFTEVAKGSTETVQDHFEGKLEWTGAGSWNGNSIYVSTDTQIKLVKAGKVVISWYGGYGNDADAEITYDAEGKATIKILTSGRYIVNIVVNTAVIPEASVNRTVSVYVKGEAAEPTLIGTIVKPHGNVINEAAVTALISATDYPGKMLDKVYVGEGTTEYDYSAIAADISLYLTLKDSSKTWQVGENIDLKVSATPVIAGVTITGDIQPNGNSLKLNDGSVIKIDAAEGTTAQINWFNHANANDTNATVTYDSTNKQIVIEIKASETGAPNGQIYIISIDIVNASQS